MGIKSLLSCPKVQTARAVNVLFAARVRVSGGRVRGEDYCFFVPAKEETRALQALRAKGVDGVLRRAGGTARLKKMLRARAGALFAAALCLAAAVICSRFVFFAQIEGGDESAQTLAMQIMEEEGFPRLKSGVEEEELEELLYQAVPQLAFVSVKVRGCGVRVNMVMQHAEPQKPQERENVYAGADGIVESVAVFSGTAEVQPGDAVKKGDLLISGRRVIGQDEKGEDIYEACAAAGEVKARVFVGGRSVLPARQTRYVRTGESVTFTQVEICGVTIGGEGECGFEFFEREESVSVFCGLPAFALTRVTYYRTRAEIYELDERDIAAGMLLREAELAPLIAGEKVLNTYKNVKRLDNHYALDIYYEVIKDITRAA